MSDGYRRLSIPAAAGGGSRLRQLDALRVLTCLSVVAVHAIGGPYPPDDPGFGVASSLLHYSREIFFFVSALVLVRTYVPRLGPDGRLVDEAAFRRRRLRLIGVPYLIWTTVYLLVWVWHTRDGESASSATVLHDLPLRWWYLVVTGNGSYHMYFLLVTLQFAVVFPLFLRVLARTQGRHGLLLAGSVALQLATLATYHWVYLPDEGWRALLGDSSLLAYQLWLVAGAIAGLHLERMHAWLTRHAVLVLAAVPLAAAALVATYLGQLPARGALGASTPLQPVMVLWSAAMLGGLYLVAVRLAAVRAPLARAIVGYGAQLSFGVYLAHPLVLDLVLSTAHRFGVFAPTPTLVASLFVLTVAGSVALCAALHRTALSLSVMGRPRLPRARHAAGQVEPGSGRGGPSAGHRAGLVATSSLLLLAAGGLALLSSSDRRPAETSWAITDTPEAVHVDGNLGVDPAGR
jgi:peptidoglycan/LPS O-acetylase OafA/YrhL